MLNFIKGPDFPTGGIVYRYSGGAAKEENDLIKTAYATGRGRTMQAKVHIEEMSRNRNRVVIANCATEPTKPL
ncbi:MAG: hypothetical protein U0401_18010 [Anaerolineae bacterium]